MPISFQNKEYTFVQPDGQKFKVKGWGNQLHAVFETLDGYTVVKDPETHFYHYAKLSADKSHLEPTRYKVGQADPGALGLSKNIRPVKGATKAMALAAFDRTIAKCRWQERREESKALLRSAMKKSGAIRAPPSRGTTGSYVGLCVLIDFPDDRSTISRSDVSDFCNKKGYTGYGNNGSVHDYFYDVSGGRLDYTNIVTEYYTAKHNKAYYSNPSIEQPIQAQALINEALASLKKKKFDFSKLSADDKGYVYSLNVFYAGQCTNNWAEGLWPHSWRLDTPFSIGNGRKLMDYQITDMGDQLSLGTFCHENGHMLCDFPDLYDYGYESTGVGTYCIMCAGGNVSPANPTQVCAYLKYKAGWADSVTQLQKGKYSLSCNKNEFCLQQKSPSEYFIIENRNQAGRDVKLPASGLAIWHIDELGSNNDQDMSQTKHYECSLEQADGRYHLENNANEGDAKDLFRSGASSKFDKSTTPNSNWWDGTASKLSIKNISAPKAVMNFKSA